MGGLEVHEHQLLPSSLKAAIQWEFMPTQYIPAKKFRTMVMGSMSREMMYGDPLHTCKEVSLMEIGLKSRGIMHASVSW